MAQARSVSVTTRLVLLAAAGLFVFQLEITSAIVAQDPGVRGGEPNAGRPLARLSPTQSEYFTAGAEDFGESETVAEGMGPRLNESRWRRQLPLAASARWLEPRCQSAVRVCDR